MTSLRSYSLQQAADLLQLPSDRVVDYIKSGRLKAEFLTNIMDYMIGHEDLMTFLKQRKDFETIRKVITHRLVLVDRDVKVQDVVALELRKKNVDVRMATTDREVGMLVDTFLPDLVAVPLGAIVRPVEPIGPSLEKAKAARRKIVVYHNYLETVWQEKKDLQDVVSRIAPESVVNISRSLAPLLTEIRALMGIS